MPSNIEIKARVEDLAGLRRAVEAAGARFQGDFPQEDTFFHVLHGRLKLRVSGVRAELIHYQRTDAAGPKPSIYRLYPVADPDRLRAVLGAALGMRGVVRKLRTLFLVDSMRIHLDQVEGLGAFLELEVMLSDEQAPEEGRAIARQWMERFGIRSAQLIAGAYIDLLERRE